MMIGNCEMGGGDEVAMAGLLKAWNPLAVAASLNLSGIDSRLAQPTLLPDLHEQQRSG
jgi:hypothetical protein